MSQPPFPSSLLFSPTPTAPPAATTAPALTLSVIVPSYNKPLALLNCLRSLFRTIPPEAKLEIIVQDDASPDFNALDLVLPPVQVAVNSENIGFAGNCNAGAIRAHGDILLFLNQDCIAQENWYSPLMATFADAAIGIVGPKLVFPLDGKGERSIQSCGGIYDGGKGPAHRYIGWAADHYLVNQYERVSWTTGAALAIWRELFYKVGGFDVGYRKGYFEDADLCEKVKAMGYSVWYCPEAVFEHNVGSTGGVPPHVFKANSLRFHAKWDPYIVPDTPFVHVNY